MVESKEVGITKPLIEESEKLEFSGSNENDGAEEEK